MKYSKYLMIFFATYMVCVLLVPELAFARAGGGRAVGGGILAIICLPFIVVYVVIFNRWVRKRSSQANAVLSKISKFDKVWDEAELKKVETEHMDLTRRHGEHQREILEFQSEIVKMQRGGGKSRENFPLAA